MPLKKPTGPTIRPIFQGYEQGGLLYFTFEDTEMVAIVRDRAEFDKHRESGTALQAYCQAVNTLKFLRSDGKVELVVTISKKPYGSFVTEVEKSTVKSLHTPTGECVKWLSGTWSGDHLYEKMLATSPGMPGPVQP